MEECISYLEYGTSVITLDKPFSWYENEAKQKTGETMKTVAIEDLIISTILTFCENLAELGCPKHAEPDMWFRYLPYDKQKAVAEKMLEIEERYS